ncbi:MAG: TlyA family RNA methyltransferase [Christensenellales bacterium]
MKQPLARCLVALGAACDEKEAGALIMSGVVYVAGQRARAGQLVMDEQEVSVRGLGGRYLAKGGLKLEAALRDFGIRVAGRVCLDAGASTGGFTDCLLKHGAERVYAVDVGFGQLLGSLRQDERVRNLERTNIADASLLALAPRPDLGTCDLSYLSLRKAVPLFSAVLGGQGELICLVKPLFETEDGAARRDGRLIDSAYAPLLRDLTGYLDDLPGIRVAALTHSPVTGNTGTREFFLHILLGRVLPSRVDDLVIDACVDRALQVTPYRKPGLVPAG